MTTRKSKVNCPRAWGVMKEDGSCVEYATPTKLERCKCILVRIVPESEYRRLRKIEKEFEAIKKVEKEKWQGIIGRFGGVNRI